MKKFFKALAVVMALTLVIGTIPASAATTGPKTAKKLYIGGAKGEDENGVKSSVKKSVSYAYLLGITKAQAADAKVTAKSSKKTIAKARNDKQRVYAKGIGKATVTLTYKGKDYKVKVTVKKNAEKVNFGGDWAKVEDTFEATVGTEYTVSLPRLDGTTKLDTDKRRLEASDESVVIAPVEGQPRSFTVKFTKAGEFTVTGIAYQSKTYSKATASKAVFVTVKAGDFAASQTGAKKITVYGSFTKDTVFTVKRGTVTATISATELSEDGTSAVLTLASKLATAEYTVSAKTGETELGTATVAADAEKVDKIVILEAESGSLLKTNADRDTIYAHYDVFNQFGESVRSSYTIKWTSSFGNNSQKDNRAEGILSFTDTTAANKPNYGTQVVITGVYTGNGNVANATATLQVGLELSAGKVELVGIWNNNTKKLGETLPASFQEKEYSLVFKMLDNDGYPLAYDARYAENITFTSMSPLLLTTDASFKTDGTEHTVMIQGEEYPAVVISGRGFNAKQGGTALVKAVSTKTGIQTDINIEVVSALVLDSFTINPPDSIVVKGETTTLGFDAVDANGEKITKFRDLHGMVTLVGAGLKLSENNDGTATLTYTPDPSVTPQEGVDIPVLLMATVASSGKSSSITVNVKEKAYAAAVSKVIEKTPLYIVEDGSQDVVLKYDDNKNYLKFIDQYDREINYAAKDAAGYVVIAKYSDDLITLSGGTATSASAIVLDDTHSYMQFPVGGTATIEADRNVTATSDESVIEFYLYDVTKGKVVAGSNKKITWTIVDISQFSSFAVQAPYGKGKFASNADSTDWTTAGATRDTFSVQVTGTLANGKTIPVPDSYVIYEASLTGEVDGKDFADTQAGVLLGTYSAAGLVLSNEGDKISFKPNWPQITAPTTLDGTGTKSAFINYSKKQADGTYAYQFVSVNYTAKVYALSGSSLDIDHDKLFGNASNKMSIGVEPSKIKEFVKADPVTWGRGFWTDKDKNQAMFKASSGSIDHATLMLLLNKNGSGHVFGVDTYDDWRAIDGTVDPVIVEVSNYVEAADGLKNAITPPTHAIVGNGSNNVEITGAEIGDTFTVTYKYHGAKLVVTATVGSDGVAEINPTSNKPVWY